VSRVLAALLLVVVVAGCNQSANGADGNKPPPGDGADRYVALAERLHAHGTEIWWETDLVARWREGQASFDRAVTRLGTLARTPGVAGFKVADELGYGDGIGSPAEATRFLTDTRQALTRVAPGKPVLVDMVVPELGCLPWRGGDGCARRARRAYPAASIEAVTGYLRARLIDRLDLSTGLLTDSEYAEQGLTRQQAQAEAWAQVGRLGWGSLTTLQARKALAAAGGYAGTDADAASDVDIYVTTPVTAGAKAVDVWTWRQKYEGKTVGLLNADLSPNPLWAALLVQRGHGVRLFTHMTPSAMPADPQAADRECALAAEVFSAVFVAAGTG
jgi:hypothetical protein